MNGHIRVGRDVPDRRFDRFGHGVREVHCNTMEGIWTDLRNFLRLFRGVNKVYLSQYSAIFQVAHDFKCITPMLLRAMMLPFTFEATCAERFRSSRESSSCDVVF